MKIFDSTLGRLERSLDVRLARHNLLSGNLANVDTPGYKPKDVDFQAAMATAEPGAGAAPAGSAAAASTLHLTSAGHLAAAAGTGIGSAGGDDMPVIERAGDAPSLDGNRVDLDRTMAQMAENGMQYGAAARAAGKKLAILRYVVSDGQG
jgi:flagellar basal-body rod protein FlgB